MMDRDTARTARRRLFHLQDTVEQVDDPKAIDTRQKIVEELDRITELFHLLVEQCSDDE